MKNLSFLRWAGSKKQLLPVLSKLWNNDHKKYIEPFMGSAQLYFALSPNKAILSDVNNELVNTFSSIKESPKKVYEELLNLKINKEQYDFLKNCDLSKLDKYELAARFIFLNRFSFNGLYRTNSKGVFNVPYSNNNTGKLPILTALEYYSKQLAKTRIICLDFEKVIKRFVKSGDFVYLDPPYVVNGKKIFAEYTPQKFTTNDLGRVIEMIHYIDKVKASFVLSYIDSEDIVKYTKKWKIIRCTVNRNISGFVSGRKKIDELIITNIR